MIAATNLHTLGLFRGVGTNADGSPDFALNRAPTRAEAVTILVRLLGRETQANATVRTTPFADIPDWAAPYIGYAFANGLTTGLSDTVFGSGNYVTAAQFITLVLRALGYTSGVDFEWNSAWAFSDKLEITDGRFNAQTAAFTRGDVAWIAFNALGATFKDSDVTLYASLIESGVFTLPMARSVGLVAPAVRTADPEPVQATVTAARPDITIEGDAAFIKNTQNALEYIWKRCPDTYQMVATYISIIKQGAQSGMWAFLDSPTFVVGKATSDSATAWYASAIVHDAYHSKQYHDYKQAHGYVPAEVWTGYDAEMECLDAQIAFLKEAGAAKHHVDYAETLKFVNWWDVPVKHAKQAANTLALTLS